MNITDLYEGQEVQLLFTVPGLLNDDGSPLQLHETGVVDEVAEDWVSVRWWGGGNIAIFGNHPGAHPHYSISDLEPYDRPAHLR